MKDLKFSLTVECIFNIMTKGILVTGKVETGVLYVGDEMELLGDNPKDNSVKKAKCSSIERYLKPVKSAKTGEYIGIILSGITRYDVTRGMKLVIKD